MDTCRSSRPCARHARDCGLRNTSGLYAVGTSTMHSEHRSIGGRGAIFGKRPPHRCLSAGSAPRPRDAHRFLSSRRSAAFAPSVSCCSPAKCLVCANATRRRRLGRWALRPGRETGLRRPSVSQLPEFRNSGSSMGSSRSRVINRIYIFLIRLNPFKMLVRFPAA